MSQSANPTPLAPEELERYQKFVGELTILQACLKNHRALIIAGLSGVGDEETLTRYRDWLAGDDTLTAIFQTHSKGILAVLTSDTEA